MIALSPWTTFFFDPQQPQVLLPVTLRLHSKVLDIVESHQVLEANLDLDSFMCVYEGKHLLDPTKDSTHNSTKTLESFWVQNPRSTKEAQAAL